MVLALTHFWGECNLVALFVESSLAKCVWTRVPLFQEICPKSVIEKGKKSWS